MSWEMTPQSLRKLCRDANLYASRPDLNDILHLHHKGITEIKSLDEYTGLLTLYLECNAIDQVGDGLKPCQKLRCLYLGRNLLDEVDGLDHLKDLESLDLSDNQLTDISGLVGLEKLKTLNLSGNRLKSRADLEVLRELPNLTSLDLATNKIDDPEAVQCLREMGNLTLLRLNGNPVTQKIPHYRKSMMAGMPQLSYLDEMPCFEKDRRLAQAFVEGGPTAEKAMRQTVRDEEAATRERHRKNFDDMVERAKEAHRLNPVVQDPNRFKARPLSPSEEVRGAMPQPRWDDKAGGERRTLPEGMKDFDRELRKAAEAGAGEGGELEEEVPPLEYVDVGAESEEGKAAPAAPGSPSEGSTGSWVEVEAEDAQPRRSDEEPPAAAAPPTLPPPPPPPPTPPPPPPPLPASPSHGAGGDGEEGNMGAGLALSGAAREAAQEAMRGREDAFKRELRERALARAAARAEAMKVYREEVAAGEDDVRRADQIPRTRSARSPMVWGTDRWAGLWDTARDVGEWQDEHRDEIDAAEAEAEERQREEAGAAWRGEGAAAPPARGAILPPSAGGEDDVDGAGDVAAYRSLMDLEGTETLAIGDEKEVAIQGGAEHDLDDVDGDSDEGGDEAEGGGDSDDEEDDDDFLDRDLYERHAVTSVAGAAQTMKDSVADEAEEAEADGQLFGLD